MKSSVIWAVALCSVLNVNYPLSASAGFLLGLFFDPEDGGDIFLRNVGLL
jgi:hypothetical protein